MNKERILELANLIEASALRDRQGNPVVLSMADFCVRYPCETTACIAGCTVLKYDPLWFAEEDGTVLIEARAREILDLSYRTAEQLFFPSDLRSRTKEEAVRVMRTLVETGEVTWSSTR